MKSLSPARISISFTHPRGVAFLVISALLPSLLAGGSGASHQPSEGVIPDKSLVRVHLRKEMNGILVQDLLVPQTKIVEKLEFVGVAVQPKGLVVAYVGDEWPVYAQDSYWVTVEAHDGTIYEAKPVGLDQRLSLVVLETGLPPDRGIRFSPKSSLKHFTVIAPGEESWNVASPCVRAVEDKEWLPLKKASLTGLDLSGCTWVGGLALDLEGRLLGFLTRADRHLFAKKVTVTYLMRADTVKAAVKEVSRTGNLDAGWLGVYLGGYSSGIRVDDVLPESPAELAGFRRGDLIASLDGRSLSFHELVSWIRWKGPGAEALFNVVRAGEKIELPVRLGSPRVEKRTAYAFDPSRGAIGSPSVYKTVLPLWLGLGFQLENMSGRWVSGYSNSARGGVLVRFVYPDSAAFRAGFRRGDMLFWINGREVSSVADLESFNQVLQHSKDGAALEIRFLRDGTVTTATLTRQ